MSDTGPAAPILYIYRLKPGMGAEYDRLHQAVWPDLLALLDEAGIYDYQIWRHAEIVVARMRTRDGFDHAQAVTGASAVQARWTAALRHVFAEIADKNGEPLWLTEVFSHRPAEQVR
ncbi:L-rhamnose mutarotase [Devosia sp. 2618]|uniref:L-rhamnose mutarotase n=1 Tax=Devosia sp. 2618 TaxID=3156454 RepID=UPI0033976A41